MPVELSVTTLKDIGKWQDYRQGIPGNSYTWGPLLPANRVDFVVMHHSVTAQTAKTDNNWKAECDKIANLHLQRGWAGIGYRFVICSDGTVAYVGDLAHGGSNVTNNNDHEIGICFVGDFTKELPTASQVHSAFLLTDWIINNMPEYPLLTSWDCLLGHQDTYGHPKFPGATATACPGSNWDVAGDNLRTRIIQDNYSGYPNPQPPVSQTPVPTPPPPTTPPVTTPPVVPIPPEDPCAGLKVELSSVKGKLYEIDTVMSGKGWWWIKYQKVKEILTH